MTRTVPRLAHPAVLFGALAGLLGSLLVAAYAAAPANAAPLNWCADGKPAPCLVSATRDGVAVDPSTVTVDRYSAGEAADNTGFTISGLGAADLGHTYVVTMKIGSMVPRIVDGWGRNGRTERYIDADGDWAVRITVQPAHMLMSCSYDPAVGDTTCPGTAAPADEIYNVGIRLSDAAWYGDSAAARDKLWGLESYSDIQLFWYPPSITVSTAGVVTMDFLMQNAHFFPDGSTTFHGTANMRIPNRVLRDLYGIPDPETMTDGSFTSTSTSGSVASYQEIGDDAWRIDLTGVTFSRQHLELQRGVITPTRPTDTRTTRVSGHKGRVGYSLSKPRGARVTGYDARCVSAGGHVVTATRTGDSSPVTVTGLHRGTAYMCKVRARSKAGKGTWSLGVRMPAHSS